MNGILLLLTIALAEASHRHHPKFMASSEESFLDKVTCTRENENERMRLFEESSCGAPKDEFVTLTARFKHEQIIPGAVWIKKCKGLCDNDVSAESSGCYATKTRIRYIPVRIHNIQTGTESCAVYPKEEDVECGCCALSPEKCAAPLVLNRRKCACQCPLELRRKCLHQHNMKWNRSKCACEEKKQKFLSKSLEKFVRVDEKE